MKCLNCGNELPDEALFCDNCGQKILQGNDNPENGAVEENVSGAEKTINFCGECGAEIEIGTDFCGNCGAAINTQNTDKNYVFCGNCGTKNPDYMQMCSNCGKALHSNDDVVSHGKSHSKKVGIIISVSTVLILGAVASGVGYMLNSGSLENNDSEPNVQISASPEPSATQKPESTPTESKSVDAHMLETYYAVNCDKSISLRESPDTSAAVLEEIPLGDPVSYVEPAQNGFAKVIYNGTTGYALQSYLSDNLSDIKRSDSGTAASGGNTDTSSDNGSSAKNQKTSGVISHPTYNTYTDSAYKFTCTYPDHFTEAHSDDPFVKVSYKAPDDTATLNICGTDNNSNLSTETVQYNFKLSYPGTIDYEKRGDDWCVCRTYKDGIYHYGYFKIKDGMIRGFELHFDGDYYTIYDGYVNDIYSSLVFR